jgi:hypothetical protein
MLALGWKEQSRLANGPQVIYNVDLIVHIDVKTTRKVKLSHCSEEQLRKQYSLLAHFAM